MGVKFQSEGSTQLIGASTQSYYNDSRHYGNYQYIHLKDVINNFIISYVGRDKIISKVIRLDVSYHATTRLC